MERAEYENYTGQSAPDTFEALKKEAGVLLRLLLGPGAPADVEQLPAYRQALAFQVLNLQNRGAAAFSVEEEVDGATIGKFSYQAGSRAKSYEEGPLYALGLSPLAVEILKGAGLVYRGAVVLHA